MKLPNRAKEVTIYVNEILYVDSLGSSKRLVPPKWMQNALEEFWNRAKKRGEDSVKDILKELVR